VKNSLTIDARTLFFLLVLFSCADNRDRTEQWTKDAIEPIELSKLIAGYNDGDGISLLIKNGSSGDSVLKVTRNSGYPDIIDTLVLTDRKTFKSLRHRTLFSIQDSIVTVTFFQKIIHPSSNWQGQTPWQETIISNYPRRDLRLTSGH
jgi:hypothetical protein